MANKANIETIVNRLALKSTSADNIADAAAKLGFPRSKAFRLAIVATEKQAGTLDSVKATPGHVKKLRDRDHLRWERIAARCGVSPLQAKVLYNKAAKSDDAARMSYVGRGRNYTKVAK